MVLRRVRKEEGDEETVFTEHRYGGRFPYRAEISFATIDEIRQLHKLGRVIGVRMSNEPEEAKQPQRNIVGVNEIEGL